MKSLARGYIWWPGLDLDLENEVKQCSVCQSLRNNPAPAPAHPWEWTAQPWSRLHLDYAGPIHGENVFTDSGCSQQVDGYSHN